MDRPRNASVAERALRRAAGAAAASRLASNLLVQLNVRTHRTWALPILLYAPTSRCNSRCLSCDWWRTDGSTDLTRDEIAAMCSELSELRTKLVVFTGGEPLVREDVFQIADLFRAQGVALHLLTSGLALERHAKAVVERFDAVTISLDGHTADLYRAIRGVDGLAAVERGVRRLKELRPGLTVRARATLQKRNFAALPHLIDKANAMGLDQISFLAADVASEAFGRKAASVGANTHGLLLEKNEIEEFEQVIEKAIVTHAKAFSDRLVAEPGERLRNLARYYRASQGCGAFPEVRCNAPWASAVVESDGGLRPCFFHPRVGTIRQKSLRALLDDEMVRFRRELRVSRNATCQRCVCSLNVGMRSHLW